MKATLKSVTKLVKHLATVPAIPQDEWQIEEEQQYIIASNSYHIIDRHGLYDTMRPFKLIWERDMDLLSFRVEFDIDVDRGLDGLRSYLDGLIIDEMLGNSLS